VFGRDQLEQVDPLQIRIEPGQSLARRVDQLEDAVLVGDVENVVRVFKEITIDPSPLWSRPHTGPVYRRDMV
jgi:hypothetical protein